MNKLMTAAGVAALCLIGGAVAATPHLLGQAARHPGGGSVLVGDTASATMTLAANMSLMSSNGDYQILMTADGDLVENSLYGISPIYHTYHDLYGNHYIGGGNSSAESNWTVTGTYVGRDVTQIWHSGTGGNSGARAVLKGDGNFVVYSASNAVLWASNTAGHPDATLTVQDDGNVVLYSNGQALWATKTVSAVDGQGNPTVNFRSCPQPAGLECEIITALPSGTGITMLCWESVPPVGWATPPPSNKWFYVLVGGTTGNLGFIDAGFVDYQIKTPPCIAPTSSPNNPPQPVQAPAASPAVTPSDSAAPGSGSTSNGSSDNGSSGSPSTGSADTGSQGGSSSQGNTTSTPPASTASTFTETVGGPTHTWTNYSDAGGTEGPTIPTGQSVQVTCVVQGFKVADGNTNWYLIASSSWNNAYYASADAFYNNGATSGSLHGTPYVDPVVPPC